VKLFLSLGDYIVDNASFKQYCIKISLQCFFAVDDFQKWGDAFNKVIFHNIVC